MGVRIVRGEEVKIEDVSLSEILKRTKTIDRDNKNMILKDIMSIIVMESIPDNDTENKELVKDIVIRYAKAYMDTKNDIYLITMYKLLLSVTNDKSVVKRIYSNVVNTLCS